MSPKGLLHFCVVNFIARPITAGTRAPAGGAGAFASSAARAARGITGSR